MTARTPEEVVAEALVISFPGIIWDFSDVEPVVAALRSAGLLAEPVDGDAREALGRAIASVTDLWPEPLDEVHDLPPVVNAILAAGWRPPALVEAPSEDEREQIACQWDTYRAESGLTEFIIQSDPVPQAAHAFKAGWEARSQGADFEAGYQEGFKAGLSSPHGEVSVDNDRQPVTEPVGDDAVERAARAICVADEPTLGYERRWPDTVDQPQWTAYLPHARAALEAAANAPTEPAPELEGGGDVPTRDLHQVIDELKAQLAGETVTTVDELEALPDSTVILDASGGAWQNDAVVGWESTDGAARSSHAMKPYLPARVLFRPSAEGDDR